MPFAGDISKLGELAEHIRTLAGVPSRAAKTVSEDLYDLIKRQFATGTDPYGEPWAPLSDATIKRGRTEPPLYATGSMFRSLDVKPMQGAGVSISIDPPANFHQSGTKYMPSRPILPNEEDLPAKWEDAIRAAVDAEVQEAVK